MNKEPFSGNRNDFASIEEYADGVIHDMLVAVNFRSDDSESCDNLIDLFRDHLIWEINPDYFA